MVFANTFYQKIPRSILSPLFGLTSRSGTPRISINTYILRDLEDRSNFCLNCFTSIEYCLSLNLMAADILANS